MTCVLHKFNATGGGALAEGGGGEPSCVVGALAPEDVLNSNSKDLLNLDRWFYIELAFLEHVCKEGGEKELQRQYQERCGSSAGVTVAEAHQRAKDLMSQPLFKFVSEQGQSGVKAAAGMLRQVMMGQPPVVSAKSSHFLKTVHADLVNFVEEKAPQGSGSSGEAVKLRGIPAMEAKLQRVLKAKQPDMKDLEILCVHAAVAFNEESRRQVMELRDQALSKVRKTIKPVVAAKSKCRRKEEFDGMLRSENSWRAEL